MRQPAKINLISLQVSEFTKSMYFQNKFPVNSMGLRLLIAIFLSVFILKPARLFAMALPSAIQQAFDKATISEDGMLNGPGDTRKVLMTYMKENWGTVIDHFEEVAPTHLKFFQDGFSDGLNSINEISHRPAPATLPKIHAPHRQTPHWRSVTRAAGPAGPCDVRGVMLHLGPGTSALKAYMKE